MQVRVREVVGTVRTVDAESLLTPQLMEQIVNAVLQAVAAQRTDGMSRARDTRIGGEECGCEEHSGGEHG